MQKRESNIVDIDQMMNERFGAVGTESRNEFRKEAYALHAGNVSGYLSDDRAQTYGSPKNSAETSE